MKTKFLTQLFLLVFVSLSLFSCTADSVDDGGQKNNVTPKILVPVADDGSTVVEPNIPKPK
jgi:hypothetical protein